MLQTPRKIAVLFGLVSGGLICLSGSAWAQSSVVNFQFQPPKLDAAPVCAPPDVEAVALAKPNSVGTPSDTKSLRAYRQDIRILMRDSPSENFEAILAIIDLATEVHTNRYSEVAALHDRISAYLAANKASDLRNLNIIPQFIDAVESSQATGPRFQYAAAQYLIDGTGIAPDDARGVSLLVSSAFGGYHEALLDLVQRQASGEAVVGWDVEPEISLTLALGGIVGELDEGICDRAKRIARFFMQGQVVAPDFDLAQAWLEFAAELGDKTAPWIIAELHLDAEDVDRDIAILEENLRLGASRGVFQAQFELAKLVEVGAVLPQDLELAKQLYEGALPHNPRLAQTRLLGLLDDNPDLFEDPQATRISLLDALSHYESSKGWTTVRLYELANEETGYWTDETLKREMLREAQAAGHHTAGRLLADRLLVQIDEQGVFGIVQSNYINAATLDGDLKAFERLRDLHLCRSVDAPNVDAANHWKDLRQQASPPTVTLSANELGAEADLVATNLYAVMQGQAVAGRAAAVASLLSLDGQNPERSSDLAFWAQRASDPDHFQALVARKMLELAESRTEKVRVLESLESNLSPQNTALNLLFAKAVIETNFEVRSPAQTAAMLHQIAQAGEGAAFELLVQLGEDPVEIYERYAEEIWSRGDYKATMFAIAFGNPKNLEVYVNRLRATVPCSFRNVMGAAVTFRDAGQTGLATQWADIASAVSTGEGWQYLSVGDLYASLPNRSASALVAFERAKDFGSRAGYYRLMERLLTPDLPETSYDEAVALLKELLNKTDDGDLIAAALTRYDRVPEEVRRRLDGQFDLGNALRSSAEAGVPHAMRNFARYLRTSQQGPHSGAEIAVWFQRAAEAGDAPAMMEYAEILAFGLGVVPNATAAREWVMKASESGHQGALELAPYLDGSTLSQ